MSLKTTMRVLLSGALILTMLVSVAAAQDDEVENILINSDFVDGTNGWTLGAGGNSAGTIAIDNQEDSPVDIGNVMYADITAVGPDGWNPELHSPSFPVEANETFTASFWAKADGSRPLNVKFEQLETYTGPSQSFTLTEEWVEYHLSPVMTVDSPPLVVLHIAFNNVVGEVWFSHFRVYEGEYVEEELDEGPKIAVTPTHRLTTTWGQIKNR